MFEFLIESKAFRNEEMAEKYSVKEMSDIFFAMLMALHLLGRTKYVKEARSYAEDSVKYPTFERIYLSGTDLANAIGMLRNAEKYLGEKDVSLPVQDIKNYFRNFNQRNNNTAFARTLFYKIQQKLKISDSSLYAFRRDIVDNDLLTFAQKRTLGNRLYQRLRQYEYKCDILALLQKFMDDSSE